MTLIRKSVGVSSERLPACAILVCSAAVWMSLFLSACQDRVEIRIDDSVPAALVQPSSKPIGLYLPAALTGYRYEEKSDTRGHWSIDLGSAQSAMMRQVMTDLFSNLKILTSDNATEVDVVMTPTLTRSQFSTPSETGLEHYEAWLEYQIDFSLGSGQSALPWRVSGYGQAPKLRLGGTEAQLKSALELALRNVGAKIATQLRSHEPLRKALEP